MGVALLQSANSAGSGEPFELLAGNIRVDLAAYQAYVAGETVPLTFQEFELLRLLVANRDRILPYEELIRGLWRDSDVGTPRRLGVVICRLRAKLAGSWPYRVQTIRGRGYGLMASALEKRPG